MEGTFPPKLRLQRRHDRNDGHFNHVPHLRGRRDLFRDAACARDHDPPATSNPAQVQLKGGNEATTPRITAPSTSLLFRVGQELTLTDSATDPEDGAMANDELSWEVIRHTTTATRTRP